MAVDHVTFVVLRASKVRKYAQKMKDPCHVIWFDQSTVIWW
jgi:hypothetical protein